MTFSHSSRHLKKFGFITVVLLLGLNAKSNAAYDSDDAYFPGLTVAKTINKNCLNHGAYSIKTVDDEGDQNFHVYKNKDCSKENKLSSYILGVDANLAGVWKDFLVFDEGTDVNSRNLRLISLTKTDEVFNFYFETEPRFEKEHLIFYEPTTDAATGKECEGQAEEVAEWKRMEFPIFLAVKTEFYAETRTTKKFSNSYRCFGVQ